MRKFERRKVRESGRRAGWSLAIAAIGTFLWVGTVAAPAQADSNFERGFEDQMGRILAYEAVNLGKHILFQGVIHPAVHHSQHGYGYDDAHYGYSSKPHRYPRRPVPVYTHEYGKRPYHFRDHHRGKRYGHYKHEWKKRKHYREHRRERRHRRHHDDCYH